MKNKIILILFLAFSSLLSGILISKMSLLSKVGITFIYDDYTILKSWWQTALIMFIIQAVIFVILSAIQYKKRSLLKHFGFPALFLVIGIIGMYLTFVDFTETSHRMMNISFKSGFYIFWNIPLLPRA